MGARNRLAAGIGIVGELLATLGVISLLFLVYQLWWTNVVSDHKAAALANSLSLSWGPPAKAGVAPGPELLRAPANNTAFGLVYIPKLRDKVWGLPLLQGDTLEQLSQGMAHYPGTALPGQVGNFAMAGHRMTHGARLSNVDHLVNGDVIIVRTRYWWYTYSLYRHQVVSPYDWWVVAPVPERPGVRPTEAIMTMTTCNPKWQAIQRWVWWGRLVSKLAVNAGHRPSQLGI